MFKWEVKAEAITTASVKDVWKLWSDVSSWSHWSRDLEWSRLEGPFAIGSTGLIKPKGWPESSFILTEIQEGKSFSNKSLLPKTNMIFAHEMTAEKNGVRIMHKVTVQGLLAPLLWFTMRWMLKKSLPDNVKQLALRAQQ